MKIVCQQTILMKYYALFVIFEKSSNIWNCRLLQIIGGALRIKREPLVFSCADSQFLRKPVPKALNLTQTGNFSILSLFLQPFSITIATVKVK